MKPSLIVFLVCICFSSIANPVYTKLYDVNNYWASQKDIDRTNLADVKPRTETEWIQLHLQLVEKTLRARSTAQLSASQKQNRLAALNHLHEYWQAGCFPQNEEYSYRLPIFIDKYDNFCAVGFLVKATGHEQVSRMISEKTNYAYVREMNYPELFTWADAYGFTVDELAWIQPSYGPDYWTRSLGKGTNGVVKELFVSNDGSRLFVGGMFDIVDSSVAASNVAYITENKDNYTWHSMNGGVNGKVNAIQEYDGKIFVAGSFDSATGVHVNNVTYWDGNKWNAAGCIHGEVKDLIVYKGELYASGSFDVCAALAEVNFAKWDGSNYWQQLPGLSGVVNTMEVQGDDIVLGGNFTYLNNAVNVIKWNDNGGFSKFGNEIINEVNDFQVYKGVLFAACRHTEISDTSLFLKLSGNNWVKHNYSVYFEAKGQLSLNTLCINEEGSLLVGGDFYMPVSMTSIANSYSIFRGGYYSDWLAVDSTINKIALFGGKTIFAGAFTLDSTNKGIAYGFNYKKYYGIEEQQQQYNKFKVYPNPVTTSSVLHVETGGDKGEVSINSLDGKLIYEQTFNSNTTDITVPAVNSGTYLIKIKDENGNIATRKLLVK